MQRTEQYSGRVVGRWRRQRGGVWGLQINETIVTFHVIIPGYVHTDRPFKKYALIFYTLHSQHLSSPRHRTRSLSFNQLSGTIPASLASAGSLTTLYVPLSVTSIYAMIIPLIKTTTTVCGEGLVVEGCDYGVLLWDLKKSDGSTQYESNRYYVQDIRPNLAVATSVQQHSITELDSYCF